MSAVIFRRIFWGGAILFTLTIWALAFIGLRSLLS
jgi:hypothetical protein